MRYTYVDKIIRAGNPDAEDVPYIAQASAGIPVNSGKKGYDPFIFEIQGLLIKHGYRFKHDGFSGTHTTNAIKSFQQKHRLRVTGIADQQTLAKLRSR